MKVGIIHPGNRVDKMVFPLKAVDDITVEMRPDDRNACDILLVDNADRHLGKEVLQRPIHDARLVYRMRGDVFHELDLWNMAPHKRWIAKHLVLPNVGACIAVCDWLAEKFQRKTGTKPVGAAGLPKRVDDWPDVNHRWEELRLSTLTNANYLKKIQAIVDYAPVVDDVLAETGGWWEVGADGDYANYLRLALEEFDNVEMVGYVDAAEQLKKSNGMLHLSYLDGQPNSVLEGMASGLPVLTNGFDGFRQLDWPVCVADDGDDLADRLHCFTDPTMRDEYGCRGQSYVREHHNREAIGQQYLNYFRRLRQ